MTKTATLPPLRVDPELRSGAESVLEPGESLSSFVAQSIRATIRQRRTQAEFLARGMAAREDAKRTGKYYSAAYIITELDRRLNSAESKAKPGR